VALYGLDFSNILPLGVTVENASVLIEYNTVPPAPQTDMTAGPVTLDGRRIYSQLSGGTSAKDYRITFTTQDSLGNTWIRTALLLCAATS